jgi:hypothetical protein
MNVACNNMNVMDSGFTSFFLVGNGGVNASNFSIEHSALKDVTITVEENGYIAHSSITANNSDSIDITLDMYANIISSSIHGDDQYSDMFFMAYSNSILESCRFTGGIYFETTGTVRNSVFLSNKPGAGSVYKVWYGEWVQNEIHQNTGDVEIRFQYSPASGTVSARNAGSMFVLCDSDDRTRACNGLTLDGPGMMNNSYRSSLECVQYGCNQLYLSSPNGLADWSLETVDCACTDSHCMSSWGITCGDGSSTATVSDGNVCTMGADSTVDCCDSRFANEGQGLVCGGGAITDGDDDDLSDGAIAGIVVGCVVVAILAVIGVYWCYRTKTLHTGGTYVGLATTNTANSGGSGDYGAMQDTNA